MVQGKCLPECIWTSGFLAGIGETGELPVDFNEKLFYRLVDYATFYPDGRVVFTFHNGVEVGTRI